MHKEIRNENKNSHLSTSLFHRGTFVPRPSTSPLPLPPHLDILLSFPDYKLSQTYQ